MLQVAPKLASLLKDEYTCLGPQSVTPHLPGQSWHQFGEAADIAAVVGGKAVWTGSVAKKLAECCLLIDLRHGSNNVDWRPTSRHWHVQVNKRQTPLLVRGLFDTWGAIEAYLEERFDI